MSLLHTLKSLFKAAPRTTPAAAFDDLRAGRAVLVDVRESGEWSGGVAEGAVLLPLTDLTGSRRRWADFLRTVGDREVLAYCAAGGRSAIAARILQGEGIKAVDAGALAEWRTAGWPIVTPKTGGATDPTHR